MFNFYHLVNRGVEQRTLFLDTHDYARFVHDLFEFNDTAPAPPFARRNVGLTMSNIVPSHTRKQIVDIHAWCLMKNHYHLLVSERVENGISHFLRKLNIGYAKYFNEKYQRNGTLFQGRTKKILIEHDAQFNYILHYIHLNPLDYLKGAEQWRIRSKKKCIASVEMAVKYLDEYRWSSYQDYCGKKNFPSVVLMEFFRKTYPDYSKEIRRYLHGAMVNTGDVQGSAVLGLE